MNIKLRKLHLLIKHFMTLQLRHTTFITQSLKEIYSGRETDLIDTGPLLNCMFLFLILCTHGYIILNLAYIYSTNTRRNVNNFNKLKCNNSLHAG